jgi:hypothetical protein
VGDAEQLQAIEAGAAFRALTERHGAAEITDIRRQREGWQRDAARELATGRTGEALDRYDTAGMLHAHESREAARGALVDGWNEVRQDRPQASQLMLAHTRADVAELNQLARVRLREAGELGEDQVVATDRGDRAFAVGDRLMFLRNERSMGVKNGTLGTIEGIEGSSLSVRLDGAEQRAVRFDLKNYANIDHGYAATIHKSQGVTVDHAHLLATNGLDRHAAYVGMSRHRDTLAVHYGADDLKDRDALTRTLGRERAKDTTLDYGTPGGIGAFAERRGFTRSDIHVPAERERMPPQAARAEINRQVPSNPQLRAEQFVESWNKLKARQAALAGRANRPERRKVDFGLKEMVRTLARDPEMASKLSDRRQELGLDPHRSWRDLGRELKRSLELDRGMDR